MAASTRPPNSSTCEPAHGFPPLADPVARCLILGSMPGIASLRAGQYYAHPRNQFWPILAELLAFDLSALSYPQRAQAVCNAGIAIWDVLRSCRRSGSLDADIEADSVIANDFATFFRHHPAVRQVYFNGAAAERLFKRHVLPLLQPPQPLQFLRLPSTSPAHAALDFCAKLKAWRSVINCTPTQTEANLHPRPIRPAGNL